MIDSNDKQFIDTNKLSIHPEALRTPRMVESQYEALKLDIEHNGQIEPIVLYRGKIVDGRHRFLIAQELNIQKMQYTKMHNNSTISDIRRMVKSKETRRHETASQLAISALRFIEEAPDKVTLADAAKMFGSNAKRVGEARHILHTHGRKDILDTLFNGEKIQIGSAIRPVFTDSIPSILNWLNDKKATTMNLDIGISPREELTENENIIVSKILAIIKNESKLVQKEISSRIYSEMLLGKQ